MHLCEVLFMATLCMYVCEFLLRAKVIVKHLLPLYANGPPVTLIQSPLCCHITRQVKQLSVHIRFSNDL